MIVVALVFLFLLFIAWCAFHFIPHRALAFFAGGVIVFLALIYLVSNLTSSTGCGGAGC